VAHRAAQQVALRATLLATVPALIAVTVLWWTSRGFVGPDGWATLWCGLSQGPRVLDPTCPSPLTSALASWLARGGDVLPVTAALGLAAALVAVFATALAVRRAGGGSGVLVATTLVCAAWPGLAFWAAGGPSWVLAAALTAVGAWLVSGDADPRSAVAAGLLWGLAPLAQAEAVVIGPVAAAWMYAGPRRKAALVAAAAWASLAVVVLGTRWVAGGIPLSQGGPLLPWLVPLAPLACAAAAPGLAGRAASRVVVGAGVLLTLGQGVATAPYTGVVDEVARVDAAIGKAITQFGNRGDRVVAVRPGPLRPYAPDARIGDYEMPEWLVSESVVRPGDVEAFAARLYRAAEAPEPVRQLIPGTVDPSGYTPIASWPRDAGAVATLWRRSDAMPDPWVDTVPGGMGGPVTLADGTTFHGGVLPPVAFAGEPLLVDAYFTPPAKDGQPRVVEIELWAVGASSPVLNVPHLAGAGGYSPHGTGQAVRDRARVPIPPDLRRGRYYVTWRMRGGARLRVLEAPPFRRGRVQVGTVEVRRRVPRWWIPPTYPDVQRAPVPVREPPVLLEGPTVASGGDTNLGRRQNMYSADDPAEALRAVTALAKANLAIVNLESVVASTGESGVDKGEGGPYYYRGRPEMLEVLRLGGVDIVGTANNHSGDYGAPALLEQGALLDAMGIGHPGTGNNIDTACEPVMRHVHGLKVAYFSLDATKHYFAATSAQSGTCYLDLSLEEAWFESMHSRIGVARTVADVVLVGVHWGPNGKHRPQRDTREAGHALIDAGADAVLGHSAHYTQGIEVYRGRPILYDQGNLLFDTGGESEGNRSAVFTLVLNRYGVRQVVMRPIKLGRGFTVYAEGNDASHTLRRLRDLSALLGTEVAAWDDIAVLTLPDPPPRERPGAKLPPNPPLRPAPTPATTPPPQCVVPEVPASAAIEPITLGPLTLLGVAAEPTMLTERGMVFVDSYWRVDAPVTEDLQLAMRLQPRSKGGRTWYGDHQHCDWAWPTSRWQPGTIVRDLYGVRPPNPLPDGNYELEIGLADDGVPTGPQHRLLRITVR
jgi:poly-gamma-glutamate capsule biosynthesis protein CapA/YwtB (metallophosphatase superfamily)